MPLVVRDDPKASARLQQQVRRSSTANAAHEQRGAKRMTPRRSERFLNIESGHASRVSHRADGPSTSGPWDQAEVSVLGLGTEPDHERLRPGARRIGARAARP